MCSHALARVGGVDHDHDLVFEPVDRAVVDERALVVEDRGVLHAARCERADVVAGDPVDEGVPVHTGDLELAHVRHVEDPDVGAHRLVLGENAGWVLHRHFVAGEGNHLARRGRRGVRRGAACALQFRSGVRPHGALAHAASAISAFCTCSRFSASSHTRDCGPSSTASETSSPRCAGRQWRKMASLSAAPSALRPRCNPGMLRRASRLPLPGPSRPTRRW